MLIPQAIVQQATGAFVRIQDQLLGAAAATIDFTSIPQTYVSLQLLLVGRGDTNAASTAMTIRFNNDSGTNYYTTLWFASNATTTAIPTTGATSISGLDIAAATAFASSPAAYTMWIPNYVGTTFLKVLYAAGGLASTNANAGQALETERGTWNSTAAINQITLGLAAGNFIAGSRATLYGIL